MSEAGDEGETAFEGVLRQIDDTVPFEPGYYNESYLDRRITARMRRRDTESHAEYERILRDDADERQALMDALTINVTEFFRNPEMWDVLRTVLRERTANWRRVRVWSDIAEELEPLSDPDRYVERDEDTFRVRPSVKGLVEFETHDLIRDGARDPFDVVLCRNLLIYIDIDHKAALFDTLEASLAEDGVLVLGMTESVPPNRSDRYEPIDKRRRVFGRR
ncbi:chemotaxis protein CheR [Halobacteriales archaeon SW_8_68_21]|nr:MAG: chemotaxis protein CheR [Halobacteriales archaeon SW_8_68_21]